MFFEDEKITGGFLMRREFASIAAITLAAFAFGESQARAADPTTADCLAASDASLKSGNEHKLRTERTQLLVCASTSCPSDIRKECTHRVDEVNTQVPTIIFEVKDGAGADLSAVKVTMDGEVLTERLEGTGLSIDPGEHAFTFETPGQPRVTKRFLIRAAQKDRRELVAVGPTAVQTPPPPPLGEKEPPPPPPPPANTPDTNTSHGMGTQRVVALVAGGVGIVGLGLGGTFGAIAMSQKSDAQNVCPGIQQCATQDGVNKWSTANTSGNISTIGFIVGGVAIAGAAVLWFTAPSSSSTQVGFGLGTLQVKGTW
jgi:hypothetical protein